MKKISMMVFGLVMSVNAQALPENGYSGFQNIVQIQQRECVANKGFEITFANDHENPRECSNSRTVDLACNAPGFETMVSIALTAAATGKRINVWIDGCDSAGHGTVKAMALEI